MIQTLECIIDFWAFQAPSICGLDHSGSRPFNYTQCHVPHIADEQHIKSANAT